MLMSQITSRPQIPQKPLALSPPLRGRNLVSEGFSAMRHGAPPVAVQCSGPGLK